MKSLKFLIFFAVAGLPIHLWHNAEAFSKLQIFNLLPPICFGIKNVNFPENMPVMQILKRQTIHHCIRLEWNYFLNLFLKKAFSFPRMIFPEN